MRREFMRAIGRESATAALCVAFVTGALFAQSDPRPPHTAQPERPTVATHAGTVARGWLEFEAGVELDRGKPDERGVIGVLVAKIGLGDALQLTLAGSAIRPGDNTGGVGDFSAGLKWRLVEDNRLLGDFAILPVIKVPTGSVSRGSGSGTTDASLWLISSRDIGPVHVDLNAAWTATDAGGADAARNSWLWTASFGGNFNSRFGWVTEFYGMPGTSGPAGERPVVALLAGPTFTARAWLVFDAGFIAPIAGPQPRALYAGVTYNVGRLWGSVGR